MNEFIFLPVTVARHAAIGTKWGKDSGMCLVSSIKAYILTKRYGDVKKIFPTDSLPLKYNGFQDSYADSRYHFWYEHL